MTVVQTTPALEKVLARLVSPRSKEAYQQSWVRWCAVASAEPREWTRALVTSAVQKLSTKYKPASLRHTVDVARSVWSAEMGTKRGSPFEEVELPSFRGNIPEWNVLHPGELAKLEKELRGHKLDRLVILALAMQGWRVNELCALKWSDLTVDKDGDTIASFIGKGGKPARQMVQPEVLKAAKAWAGPAGKGVFVLGGFNRFDVHYIVTKWSKKVLGRRVTPHGLRATFISDVISRKGIEAARQLARHADIKTTQRYSRWVVMKDDVVKF